MIAQCLHFLVSEVYFQENSWNFIVSSLLGVLLEKGGFQIASFFFFFFFSQKSFITIGILFCLVNIHACCNQKIYSFMWFTFYWKMIYYEISFLLAIIFKYIL